MVLWTQRQIDPASLAYLRGLPDGAAAARRIHHHPRTSPRQPVWEYINNGSVARENSGYFDTPYCLVGHTHVPRIYRLTPGQEAAQVACILSAGTGRGYLPGRPAQPDHQPRQCGPTTARRPAFLQTTLLDTEQALWRYRCVRYDVEITQAAMRKAGLPDRLIVRLAYGW